MFVVGRFESRQGAFLAHNAFRFLRICPDFFRGSCWKECIHRPTHHCRGLQCNDAEVQTSGLLHYWPIFLRGHSKDGFDQVLAFFAFWGQRVDRTQADLETCFIQYRWGTREVLQIADKHLQERRLEVNGQFICHELQLSSIPVYFKAAVRLGSPHDAVTVPWEVFGEERPDLSYGGLAVLIQTVTGNDEGGCDYG